MSAERYISTKPCVRCDGTIRYRSTNQCVSCTQERVLNNYYKSHALDDVPTKMKGVNYDRN